MYGFGKKALNQLTAVQASTFWTRFRLVRVKVLDLLDKPSGLMARLSAESTAFAPVLGLAARVAYIPIRKLAA